jgi:8-oxo-dGTP diphosphatase
MAVSGCFPLPVVFCFFRGEKGVLLYRRMTAPWNGTVTVPGGKKELGETAREACIREIEEETGYRLRSLRLRGIAHILSGENEATGYYFSSRDFEGELRDSCEGVPFWHPAEESLSLEGINPFYSLLAPKILDETAPLFEAKILSDDRGICSFSFVNA